MAYYYHQSDNKNRKCTKGSTDLHDNQSATSQSENKPTKKALSTTNFTPFEIPTPSSRRGGTAQVIPDDDCVNKIGAEVNVLFIVGLMCTNDGKTCIDGVLCNRYGLEVFVKCGNARDDLLSESLILKGTDYVIAVERVYCSVQTS